jgi:hypothetical protein
MATFCYYRLYVKLIHQPFLMISNVCQSHQFCFQLIYVKKILTDILESPVNYQFVSFRAALVNLFHNVTGMFEFKNTIRCFLVDFTKAVDTVWHSVFV